MMKLPILLLLCALSLMVDSATVPQTGTEMIDQYIHYNIMVMCPGDGADEDYDCISRKYGEFFHHMQGIINKCDKCGNCISENLKRILFDMYVIDHAVAPCNWFATDPHTEETVKNVLECIRTEFNGLPEKHVSGVNVQDELENIQDVVKDCENEDANKGQELVNCIEESFWDKRSESKLCESKEERNTKLYNTLRQLLDRLRK